MTKSLYITSKRSTPKPSATKASSCARAWTKTTSASPRRPVSSACPVPWATTRTSIPVASRKIGRMCPNSPEFSVEVVEATVMNSWAATGAPPRSKAEGKTEKDGAAVGGHGWFLFTGLPDKIAREIGAGLGRAGATRRTGRRRPVRSAGRDGRRPRPQPDAVPGRDRGSPSPRRCPSAAMPAIRSSITRVAEGSSAAVGSSRNRTCGRMAQARARARRCCSPPDRRRAGRSAIRRQPEPVERPGDGLAPVRPRQAAQGQRVIEVRRHRPAQQDRPLEDHRLRRRARAAVGPDPASPKSASISPWQRRRNRLLPAPFAPITTRRRPASTVSETSDRSAVPPLA